jgi:tetratricopeptide (TPR) repeat protein
MSLYSLRKTIFTALCLSLLSAQYSAAPASTKSGAQKAKSPMMVRTVQPAFGETRIFRGQISTEVQAGEKDLLTADYAKAQEAFHQALNKNSRDVNALNGLGFALALQFKLDAADQQFAKALTLNSKDPLAHVGKSFVALNRLQSSNMTIIKNRQAILTAAESECQLALSLEPNMPEGNLVLGLVQKEQGKLDAAKASFTASITADPKYAAAFVNRGLIEMKQGDVATAITDFKQAIELRSSNSTAHYALGVAYSKLGQLDQALTELNTALSLKSNSAPTHIALGDVYQMQGNIVAAIKEYNAAIAIKAESESAYLKLADIFQNRGDLELAAADIRSGLELAPNNVDLKLRLADINLQLSKLDDALAGYTAVLNQQPANVAAANGMTRALVLKAQKEADGAFFVSNNFEAAENLLQRAIRMNPNSMELRLADAKLRVMSGRPADLSTIGTPTTDPQRIAFAEAALAQCRFADAQQAMTTVIQNCQTASSAFAVADIALMTRDLDSAEAAYNKASTFPGNEVQSRSQRGLSAVASSRSKAKQELTLATDLASRKQYASAIDRFRSAAYLNPRLADAHLGLAEALQKYQKNNAPALREAAQHFRAYLALSGPNLPEKEQEKITKRADKCIESAYKIDQGHSPSKLSAVFSPVENIGKKVGSKIQNAF